MNCAKYLISNGAHVDAIGGTLQATPLHWALRSGHLQMTTYLISKSANPSLMDNQGFSSLHIAVHSQNPYLVLYLYSINTDMDQKDALGRTALMWAAYQGNIETCEILMGMNVDVTIQDRTGFTAMHWAVSANQFECLSAIRDKAKGILDLQGKNCEALACERGQLKEYNLAMIPKEHSLNTRYTDVNINYYSRLMVL